MIDKNEITAVILSGGSGSDFNRQDKGFALFEDRPLIEHCAESLAPQVGEVIICCNRNQEKYQRYCDQLAQDHRPVFQGPIAGVEAGLHACTTPYALLFPSDSICAPADLAQRLAEQLEADNSDCVYLKTQPIGQYLIALIKTELRTTVSHFLDNNGRSTQELYEEFTTTSLYSDYPDGLIKNINDPADLH